MGTWGFESESFSDSLSGLVSPAGTELLPWRARSWLPLEFRGSECGRSIFVLDCFRNYVCLLMDRTVLKTPFRNEEYQTYVQSNKLVAFKPCLEWWLQQDETKMK